MPSYRTMSISLCLAAAMLCLASEQLQAKPSGTDVAPKVSSNPTAPAAIESQKLAPPAQAPSTSESGNRLLAGKPRQWMRDIFQTIAALGVVVVLIFLVRVLLGRSGRRGTDQAEGPVAIIARKTVAGRQQLLAVRFGKSVVLVGASPGGLVRLGRISNPVEVAEILRDIETGRGESFAGIFRRKSDQLTRRASAEGPDKAISKVTDKMRKRLSPGQEKQ